MKILGIDASHRNTGVVIIETIPASLAIKEIILSTTLPTKKIDGILNEYYQVRDVVKQINTLKFHHSVYTSVCEIAYSGLNFSSARGVGITWGISIGTDSTPYTPMQVRSLFPGKGAKARAQAWLLKNNFHLTSKIYSMNNHEIDAACVAMFHHIYINNL